MKFVLPICLGVFCLTLSLRGEEEQSPKKTLASMTWLAGEWRGNMWGGNFVAYYSTPVGGRILSESELLKDGGVAFYEFESFRAGKNDVIYTPHPGGKRAASFKLASHAENKAVFENPKKDFPTRVTFHRTDAATLVITLQDPHGGSDKKQEFVLKRHPAPQ
ncbi:MAG: DUF6265 family protein [Planctomycetota bacterium]